LSIHNKPAVAELYMKPFSLLFVLVVLATSAFANKKEKDPERCTRNISFAAASQNGVHSYMAGWIENWVRKNANKHPRVCFSQEPQEGLINFSIVLSDDPQELNGLQATLITTTTPYSASGYVSSGGETWRYSYSGTVSTTSQVAVPYTLRRNTLYATAYLADGGSISQRGHLYETQVGGDDQEAFATNLGNALRAINARGRLLTGAVKDIERAYVNPAEEALAAAESERRARGDYSGPPRNSSSAPSTTAVQQKPVERPALPDYPSADDSGAPKPSAGYPEQRAPTQREIYCGKHPRGVFSEDDGTWEYCDVRDDPANQASGPPEVTHQLLHSTPPAEQQKAPTQQPAADQQKTPARHCVVSSTNAKGTTCISWASN
jgi:hypothetical protein